MTEYTIHIIGCTEDGTGKLTTDTIGDECRIVLRFSNTEYSAAASDYFEAFCKIRQYLEAKGIIPFCYGASLNVYPSGMCRDMGEGIAAYRLQVGKTPTMNDLVNIFDAGDDIIPSSVENQKRYFDKWLKSKKVI